MTFSFSKYNVLHVWDPEDKEYYVITDNAHFKEIKEMLYNDMKIGEVMQKLDINNIKYTDLFHKYEIQIFINL